MCPDIVETKLLTQRQREWQPDKQVIDKWTVLYNLQKDYMDRMKPKLEGMKSYDEVLGQKLKKERAEKQNLSNLIQFQNKVNGELKAKSGGGNKFDKEDDCADEDLSYSRTKTTATKKIGNHLSDFNKLLMKKLSNEKAKPASISSTNKERLAESMKKSFQNNIDYKSTDSDLNQIKIPDTIGEVDQEITKQIDSDLYSDINPGSSMQISNPVYMPITQPIPMATNMINFDAVHQNPVLYLEAIEDPLNALGQYGKSFIKDSSKEKKKKKKTKKHIIVKKKDKDHDVIGTKDNSKNMNNTSVHSPILNQSNKEKNKISDSPPSNAPNHVFNINIVNNNNDDKKEKLNGENLNNEEEPSNNEKAKNNPQINTGQNKVKPSIQNPKNNTQIKKFNYAKPYNQTNQNIENDTNPQIGNNQNNSRINPSQSLKIQKTSNKSNTNIYKKNKSNLCKLTNQTNSKRNDTNSINPSDGKEGIYSNNTSEPGMNEEIPSQEFNITKPSIPIENDNNIDMKSLLQKNELVINPRDEISKLSSKLEKSRVNSLEQEEDSEEILDPDEDPLEQLSKSIVSPPQLSSFLETAEFINFNKNLFETLIAKSSNFNLETQRRGRRRSRFPDPQWDCAESQISKLVMYLCEEEVSSSYQKYCKPMFEQINTMVESFLYHDNNLEICQNLHMCPVTMDIK